MFRQRRQRQLGRLLWLAAAAGAMTMMSRRSAGNRTTPRDQLYAAAGHLLLSGDRVVSRARRITVQSSPEEVLRAWRDTSQLRQFVTYLQSAEQSDGERIKFSARLPGGTAVRWVARLVEERPDEALSWNVEADGRFNACLRLEVTPAPAQRGTEVMLDVEIGAGRAGEVVARIASLALHETLRRFKQWVETGEVATVEGQPSARQRERRRPELRHVAARFIQPKPRMERMAEEPERHEPLEAVPVTGTGA